MYKLGQRENLKIDKINTEVLLKKDNENNFVRMNVDELSGEKVGDVVDVFIYNDNKKLLATIQISVFIRYKQVLKVLTW